MNRRSFFKRICAFLGGLSLLGRSGASEGHPMSQSTGTPEFICNTTCNCSEQRLIFYDGHAVVFCPHHQPYYVKKNGSVNIWIYDDNNSPNIS